MEQRPLDNKNSEPLQPQMERPVLRTDLSGPENNPITLIATTQELLRGEAREAFKQEIRAANMLETTEDHDKLLEIVDHHVEVVDVSDVYTQYSCLGKVTAAVQWLNEQIKTRPQSVPCGIDGLYPDSDDPSIGPEAYLNVLWNEVAQVEQSMDQYDDSERRYLEYYHDVLMTTIVKFWRYGLL